MNSVNIRMSSYKLANAEYIDGSDLFESDLLFNNLIWLTTDEAAAFLRKSTHALRQMIYKGVIRARKVHGRLYLKKSELHELIDTSFF